MLNTIVKDLKKIASDTASEQGFKVKDVEMDIHLTPISIQVSISHLNPSKDVTINDCALLTTPINEAIEKSELIPTPFLLEISSSGISELLLDDRDFETFKGFPVEVNFKNKNNLEEVRIGLLHERSQDYLQINLKGRINRIPRDDVIRVRLTTPSG